MDHWRDWIDKHWKIVVCISSVVFSFLLVLILLHSPEIVTNEEDSQQDLYEELLESTSEENAIDEEEKTIEVPIMVDIKGAVQRPGVYEMDDNARLLEVIEKAGGFTEEADSRQVNLAQIVTDQMMIYIPREGEEIPDELVLDQVNDVDSVGRININTADITELTQLKGIGEARAASIIEYREEYGRFESVEEIKNVSGIGEAIFEGFKDEIVVN